MALITGIYDELVGTVAGIDQDLLVAISRGRFREVAQRANLSFLLPLLAGIFTAALGSPLAGSGFFAATLGSVLGGSCFSAVTLGSALVTGSAGVVFSPHPTAAIKIRVCRMPLVYRPREYCQRRLGRGGGSGNFPE